MIYLCYITSYPALFCDMFTFHCGKGYHSVWPSTSNFPCPWPKKFYLSSSRKSSQVGSYPWKYWIGFKAEAKCSQIFHPKLQMVQWKKRHQKVYKLFHCVYLQKCLLCFILKVWLFYFKMGCTVKCLILKPHYYRICDFIKSNVKISCHYFKILELPD